MQQRNFLLSRLIRTLVRFADECLLFYILCRYYDVKDLGEEKICLFVKKSVTLQRRTKQIRI